MGLAASLTFSACSLDQEPTTSLTTETAISSASDLEKAINGVGYLLSNYRMTYFSEFALYGDLRCNDFKVIDSNGQTTGISQYVNTGSDYPSETGYYIFYASLANVNNALAAAEKIESSDDVNKYKGQLLAWRAMLHFDLARIFCKIPTTVSDPSKELGLVLADEVKPTDYKGTRTDLKSTYDYIISQFTQALELLPAEYTNGYIGYHAALALRARAYLYMGEYSKALADAKEVIQTSGKSLYGLGNYLNAWSGIEGAGENLFELLTTSTYNMQRYAPGYYCDADGYSECGFNTDAYLYKYLSSHPEDVRSGLIKDQSAASYQSSAGYYPNKYPGREGSLYVNNIPVVRLSEMYLIAAEAAWHIDNPSATIDVNATSATAATYMNTLDDNRIAGYTSKATVSLADILHEYEIEMFLENQITYAYWRNKQSVTANTAEVINYDDYRVLQPIPDREINYNADLQQNPGYGK